MTESDLPLLPLDTGPWIVKTRSIGNSGLPGHIEASEADRQLLAQALDLIACDRLTVDYRVKPIGRDRFKASGRIAADLTRACVVTLDPVAEAIREDFSVAFWPADDLGDELAQGEIQLDAEVPERMEHGQIALGHLVYELIAVAMDPFPRSPRADEVEAERLRHTPRPDSPFAALKDLKKPT